MAAMPGQRVRPARFARLAGSLALALTLLALLKMNSPRRASSPVEPPAAPVTAELAGAPSAGSNERAGEQAAAAAERGSAGSSGAAAAAGAPSADGKAAGQTGQKSEPAAAQEASQPQKASEKAAEQAEAKPQPAAPAAGGEAAAPAAAGGQQQQQQPQAQQPQQPQQPQLEQVEKIDIGAKANIYLGFQVMLRAQVTPFKKCKVTSYQPKPINDAQATALLQDASKLSGQLWWAEVGSVPCRKDGCCKQLFSFRYGSTDILVFQQIFRDHYLRALYSLFPEDAAPKYILDAGANAGYATALFKLLWPDAIVVSLEPDPANFAQMRRNTAGFTGVHRVNAGLWGRQANITVSSGDCKGCEWGRTFRETLPGEKGVPAYSVNDVAKMFGIPKFDFVKIDIEGAEGRVFAPSADLSWLGGPKVVSLEIHDFFAQTFGLTAVSGHVDAAFAPHPQYQIARDNEHVFYIDKDHLAAARLSGAARAAGVETKP